MRDLSPKIGIDVQPIYTSKKLEQGLKLKEIKARNVNQHSVVYCFKCDLCDSVADHRYCAIGRHLMRDAHENIDLLNESQFRMLKKSSTKWDCLVYEMLYIRTIRPSLNIRATALGPNSLFNFQCILIYSSLHYIYSISSFYFHLIMTFWKLRARFYIKKKKKKKTQNTVFQCLGMYYVTFVTYKALMSLDHSSITDRQTFHKLHVESFNSLVACLSFDLLIFRVIS